MKKFIKLIGLTFAIVVLGIGLSPLLPHRETLPKVVKINKTTYRLQEGLSKMNMYLLIGKKKALLIDTGEGYSRVDKAVKKITDLPITVVNTHAHFDHVGGDKLFKDVYMNKTDFSTYQTYTNKKTIATLFDSTPWIFRYISRRERNATIKQATTLRLKPLPKKGYFDLGNRKVSFLSTPGHTPGSIVLYDEKNHILFNGDTGNKADYLLRVPRALSVQTANNSFHELNAFIKKNKIKKLYPGHDTMGINPHIIKNYERASQDILDGKISNKDKKSGKYSAHGVTITFYANQIKNTQEH